MISDKLKEQLGDWEILYPFFNSPEWPKIKEQLKPDFNQITPELECWFRAFKLCKYKNLKCIWLGLSPYHGKDSYTKENVADGLAFSTSERNTTPPSLFQLYKGLEWDKWQGINLNMTRAHNLNFLAEQGILLLNSALTTTYGNVDVHLEIWKPFITYLLKILNEDRKSNPIIYCGFGKVANTNLTLVDKTKHIVLEREHPAAAAHGSRYWYHENLFSEVDKKLEELGKAGILWDKYLVDEIPF